MKRLAILCGTLLLAGIVLLFVGAPMAGADTHAGPLMSFFGGQLAVWGGLGLAGTGAVSLLLFYRDKPGGTMKGLAILGGLSVLAGVGIFFVGGALAGDDSGFGLAIGMLGGMLAIGGSIALAGLGAVSLLLLYRDKPGGLRKGLAILAVTVLPMGALVFNGIVNFAVGTLVILALVWGLFLVENRRAGSD